MRNLDEKPETLQWLYAMKQGEQTKFKYAKRAGVYNAAKRYDLTIRVHKLDKQWAVVKLMSKGCDE